MTTADQKLVLAIAKGLDGYECDTTQIALDLENLPVHVQQRLFEIILSLVGTWSTNVEWTEGTGHPLFEIYKLSQAMMDGAFVHNQPEK